MVQKVHAGVYDDSATSGSLRFFKFNNVNAADGRCNVEGEEYTLASGEVYNYSAGQGVPDTVVDLIIRVVSTRATVVLMQVADDLTGSTLNLALENNSVAWGSAKANGAIADILTALQALGDGKPVSAPTATPATQTYDFASMSASNIEELNFVLDSAAVLIPGFQGDDLYPVGGIGGNEHDQSTRSNATPAPGDKLDPVVPSQ